MRYFLVPQGVKEFRKSGSKKVYSLSKRGKKPHIKNNAGPEG